MGADGFFSFERNGPPRQGFVTLPEPYARVADEAAFGFGRAFPGQSARTVLRPSQVVIARRILVLAGLAGLLAPLAAVSILMWLGLILFAAILAFRVALVLIGCLPARGRSRPIAPEKLLPVYTILVALKDEADSAAQLSRSILALDYPADRIDLKLLIETGDEATRKALLDQAWPMGTEVIVLPPGMPRKKPRALNYGLSRARVK